MDKLLVTISKQNQELINISKENKCIGFVDYHKRFDKHSKLIKKINLKNIKNLFLIDINYSQKKIISRDIFDWSSKSNVLNYLGSHYIDFVYNTSGYKPYSVMAYGSKNYLKNKNINTYDFIVCLVKWKKNNHSFLLNLKTSWVDPNNETSMSDQNVTMHYTNSKIVSDQKNRGLYISSDTDNYESINPDFNQKFSSLHRNIINYEGYGFSSIETFLVQIYDFIHNKKIDYDFYPNLEQSMIVTKVLEAAKTSLNNKSQWIEII